MTPGTSPRELLWSLVDKALDHGEIRTIHLAPGRPPAWRLAEKGLLPIDEEAPPLTAAEVMAVLCTAIEPELWDRFDMVGEGEIALSRDGGGRPIRLVAFRNSGAWSAVVHL